MQNQFRQVGQGRKRPVMQHNYHTMTNNAVFPTDEREEVIQYHTKVRKDNGPRLAPTLRPSLDPAMAQIEAGQLHRPVNDSPPMSPLLKREGSPASQFISEYQARMMGQGKPEFQVKKATGKKSLAPIYVRQKHDNLHGGGMQIADINKVGEGGAFIG